MAEWSIAAVSKTVEPSRVPEVRILSLPPASSTAVSVATSTPGQVLGSRAVRELCLYRAHTGRMHRCKNPGVMMSCTSKAGAYRVFKPQQNKIPLEKKAVVVKRTKFLRRTGSVTIFGVLDDARSHAFWIAGTKWGGNHETQEYELGNSNCAGRRGGSRIFGSSR